MCALTVYRIAFGKLEIRLRHYREIDVHEKKIRRYEFRNTEKMYDLVSIFSPDFFQLRNNVPACFVLIIGLVKENLLFGAA